MPTNSEARTRQPYPPRNTYRTERFKRMDKNSDGQISRQEAYGNRIKIFPLKNLKSNRHSKLDLESVGSWHNVKQ